MDRSRGPGKRFRPRRGAAWALAGSSIILSGALAIGGQAIASSRVQASDSTAPTQTIYAPGSQKVGSLYLLVQLHERGQIAVSTRVSVGGHSYRARRYTKSVPPHITNTVRVRFSSATLRRLRRALRHRRGSARVTSRGTDTSGNSRSYRKTIRLRA
jgi:hypothetical protein